MESIVQPGKPQGGRAMAGWPPKVQRLVAKAFGVTAENPPSALKLMVSVWQKLVTQSPALEATDAARWIKKTYHQANESQYFEAQAQRLDQIRRELPLTERQREIWTLSLDEGLNHTQISERLGLDEAVVLDDLKKAYAQFRCAVFTDNVQGKTAAGS